MHTRIHIPFNPESNYQLVALPEGAVVFVDTEDYHRVIQHSWYVDSYGYPSSNVNGKRLTLHKFVMGVIVTLEGHEYHHKNDDKFDNRKANLVLLDYSEHRITRPVGTNNTSGFKGVHWDKQYKNWKAQISINGKRTNLGRFKTPEEAAKVYDSYALKYYGLSAYTNFPNG